LSSVPRGFLLCDGQTGTPDLRDRFIIGASDTYHPRATGGATTHTHTFTSDGHSHDILPGAAELELGTDYDDYTSEDTDSGTTDAGSSLPPYYALAFIIKT